MKQIIMETRDQWYKPNLLYNIHYRPPKKPDPPKMIVETVQFNPSVCTCGEHSCQPQYRMKKRVLWTNKEEYNAKQHSKVNDREKKNEYRESKFEERITKQNSKIGSVTESDQMELKVKNNQEFRFVTEDDGFKCCSAESVKERRSENNEVRSGYKVKYSVKEKENVNVGGDDINDDEKEQKQENFVCKNEFGYSDSKDDICIDEEGSDKHEVEYSNSKDDICIDEEDSDKIEIGYSHNKNDICIDEENSDKTEIGYSDSKDDICIDEEDSDKIETGYSNSKDDICIDEKESDKNEVGYSDSKDDMYTDEEDSDTNINGRSERDSSGDRESDRFFGEKSRGNGPYSVLSSSCKWSGKSSVEGQIDKDQTTGEVDGRVSRDGANDGWENCSENIFFINKSDSETAGSCSLESKDNCLDDVEIASAFGIMSIYCNSELHSWMTFEGCFKGKIH